MSHARITRREFVRTAGATVPIIGASLAAAGQGTESRISPTVGISTQQFTKYTNAQLA